MTEPVIIALISAASLAVVALISLVGRVSFQITRVRRDTAVTREQVANDHTTNLREEQDTRHDQNTRTMRTIMRLIGQGASTLATMQDDIKYLRNFGHENRQRIEEIENTQPRAAFAPPPRHRKEAP